ncbi:MAG: NUDIX hydrolase, partial [Dehalococcoidia bacterium]
TVESRRIYRGSVVGLRVDTVRLFHGGLAQREIVEHGDSVCIVPLDEEERVLLVQQYRKPVGESLLEVPAGGVEQGESLEECALRELQEETGYTAESLQHLASFWMTPGFCTERMHAYLAMGLKPGGLQPEPDEAIQMVRVPLGRVAEEIRQGHICDAKSIASLLLVLHTVSLRPQRPG